MLAFLYTDSLMMSDLGERIPWWDIAGSHSGCSWVEPVKTSIPKEADPGHGELMTVDAWSDAHSQGLLLGNVVPEEAWSDVHCYFISCR